MNACLHQTSNLIKIQIAEKVYQDFEAEFVEKIKASHFHKSSTG